MSRGALAITTWCLTHPYMVWGEGTFVMLVVGIAGGVAIARG